MDTPQIRWSFYYSFGISSQIQYRYTPDTAVILLLIQTSAIRYILDTLQTRRSFYLSFRFNYQPQVQICSRHGCYSISHSDSTTNFKVQMRSKHGCLSGPYTYNIQFNKLSRMASLSPFPQLHSDECKFTGTLVSNHLLPLSHER